MKGFVYFIRVNGLDPIKIGYTTDPKGVSRFETLKTYAPFGATYFAHIPTLNAPALEFELHETFKDKRLKGEWFDLTQKEVAKIVYQKGGKFGEPTIDFDEFVKDEIEKQIEKQAEENIIKNPQTAKWYQSLPDEFKRDIFYTGIHAENLIKYQIGGITGGKLARLLTDKNLFEKEQIKGGYYKKICNLEYVFNLRENVKEWYNILPQTFTRKELLTEDFFKIHSLYMANSHGTIDKYLKKLVICGLLKTNNIGQYTKTTTNDTTF